jgi:hypothetical protein
MLPFVVIFLKEIHVDDSTHYTGSWRLRAEQESMDSIAAKNLIHSGEFRQGL